MGSRGTNRRLRDGSPGRPAVGKQTTQWIESLQAEMSEIKTQLEQKELKKKSQPGVSKQQARRAGSNAGRRGASPQDRASGALQLAKPKQANPKFSTSPESRKNVRQNAPREASSRGASPMSGSSARVAIADDDAGTGGSSSTGGGRGGRRSGRAAGRGLAVAVAAADADAGGTGTTLAIRSSPSSASREPKQALVLRGNASPTTPSPERKKTRSLSPTATRDEMGVTYPRSLSPEWGPLPCWPGAMPNHNRQGAGWGHRTAKQRTDTDESKMPLYHTTEPWNRTRNSSQSSVWSRERSSRTSPMQWGNAGNYVVESRMDGKNLKPFVRRLHREMVRSQSASSSAPQSASQSPSPSSRGRKAKGSDIAPVLKSDLRGAGQRAPPPIALPVQKVSSVLEEWYCTKQQQITGVGGDVNGLRHLADWAKATGPEFHTAGRRRAGWSFSGDQRRTAWVTRGVDRQAELEAKSMTRVAVRRNQSQEDRRPRSEEQDRFTSSLKFIGGTDAPGSARVRSSSQHRSMDALRALPRTLTPDESLTSRSERPRHAPVTSRSNQPDGSNGNEMATVRDMAGLPSARREITVAENMSAR